jgi:hypothetical protein
LQSNSHSPAIPVANKLSARPPQNNSIAFHDSQSIDERPKQSPNDPSPNAGEGLVLHDGVGISTRYERLIAIMSPAARPGTLKEGLPSGFHARVVLLNRKA